jgi:16S rRNA (uracil1498-N3)-methyltransferase
MEGRPTGVRVFVPRSRLTPPHQLLTAEDRRYLFKVHRLRAGDAFEVFDGEGGRHDAVVDAGLKSATLGEARTGRVTPAVALELWQGIPKGEKLDLVIQKATELGVTRLVPLTSQTAVRKLAADRLPKQLQRFRRIAEQAARQCGRADVPEIAAPRPFEDFLARAQERVLAAVVYEGRGQEALWRFLTTRISTAIPPLAVALAIGPEGGFTPHEVDRAREAGVPLVSLGSRILRTETAAIVACALVQAASGGFD